MMARKMNKLMLSASYGFRKYNSEYFIVEGQREAPLNG